MESFCHLKTPEIDKHNLVNNICTTSWFSFFKDITASLSSLCTWSICCSKVTRQLYFMHTQNTTLMLFFVLTNFCNSLGDNAALAASVAKQLILCNIYYHNIVLMRSFKRKLFKLCRNGGTTHPGPVYLHGIYTGSHEK